MEIIQIIGIAIVVAIAAILLKSTKPELSFAIVITGSIAILVMALNFMADTFKIFKDIAELTGIDNALVKIILKILGIGYLVEFSAGVVEDFGYKSLADKLVFAGKVIIFTVSVPILQSMLKLIGKFMELI